MPCAEDLAWIVEDLSALRTSAPNAFKQFSAPSDFGATGIRPAAAATISGGFRQDFPLGEIIPRRTTPELRYLFAELGAALSGGIPRA